MALPSLKQRKDQKRCMRERRTARTQNSDLSNHTVQAATLYTHDLIPQSSKRTTSGPHSSRFRIAKRRHYVRKRPPPKITGSCRSMICINAPSILRGRAITQLLGCFWDQEVHYFEQYVRNNPEMHMPLAVTRLIGRSMELKLVVSVRPEEYETISSPDRGRLHKLQSLLQSEWCRAVERFIEQLGVPKIVPVGQPGDPGFKRVMLRKDELEEGFGVIQVEWRCMEDDEVCWERRKAEEKELKKSQKLFAEGAHDAPMSEFTTESEHDEHMYDMTEVGAALIDAGEDMSMGEMACALPW